MIGSGKPIEILVKLYKYPNGQVRNLIVRAINRLEGGEFRSVTLREIFRIYHFVEIGLHTHGGCFMPGAFDKHTKIGRYCSVARPVRVMNRNHPLDFKSMHAYFFNPALKIVSNDSVEYNSLEIGNDVWLGYNCIILPGVKRIGDGAVIGAGASVNKDVPPYAVVIGNPGRIVRYRFSQETIQRLLESKWWEMDIGEIKKNLKEYVGPYEKNGQRNGELIEINK